MSELKAWLWPDMSSRRQIGLAIFEGYWAAIIVAVVSGLLTIASLFTSLGPETLMQIGIVVLLSFLAYGIGHRSRAAATSAFALFVLDRLVVALLYGPRGILLSIIVAAALLNAMRGTFAYRKLPVAPPGTPSLEESFKAFRKVPIPPQE